MHVSALRLDDGELRIIITPDATSSAIADYAQRWELKLCLEFLKPEDFVSNQLILLMLKD